MSMQITENFRLQNNVQIKTIYVLAFGYTSKPPHPILETPECKSRHATDGVMLANSERYAIARI